MIFNSMVLFINEKELGFRDKIIWRCNELKNCTAGHIMQGKILILSLILISSIGIL